MKNPYKIEQRIKMELHVPEAYKILIEMEKFLGRADLTPINKHLIKIRASQLNGCAYCIQMHTKEAIRLGESAERIYSIPAWKESPLFSEEERAIFKLTDEVTNVQENGVSDETFEELEKHFSENQIAVMIIAISQINVWNRIALASRMSHTSE